MIAYLFLYFLVWEIFDSIDATVSEPEVDIKRKNKQESYKLHTPKSLEISFPIMFISLSKLILTTYDEKAGCHLHEEINNNVYFIFTF